MGEIKLLYTEWSVQANLANLGVGLHCLQETLKEQSTTHSRTNKLENLMFEDKQNGMSKHAKIQGFTIYKKL